MTWDLRAPEAFLIDCKEQLVPGHSGGDPGITSFTFYLPEQKTGVILFINQTAELEFKTVNLLRIVKRMFEEAQKTG